MIAIDVWLGFAVASGVLVAIPGPTILTVISYATAYGKRASLPLVAAVALGDSTALILSLAGLGAVLASSAWMFTIIKWIGGVYLVYLGLSLIKAGIRPVIADTAPSASGSRWKLFRRTWLVTALNPKGIIFFIAFLPQFVDRTTSVTAQLWLLSITFVVIATLNAILYVVFATHARKLLASSTAQRRFNLTGGGLLTLAGGWALTAKQLG